MRVVFGLTVAVLLAVSGCTPRKAPVVRPAAGDGSAAPTWQQLPFDDGCTAAAAASWAQRAAADPRALLFGAACAVAVAERAENSQEVLRAAERGRRLAEDAVGRWPLSAAAHYLLAYATGLVAEQQPLQGLKLVPVIERAAQRAAELDGAIDRGGPERMLGDLYLQAPSFPVSIGDSALAVEHFRRAKDLAPAHPANRLGLIEALLAEDRLPEACEELATLLAMQDCEAPPGDWQRILELHNRLCRLLRAG